MTGKRGTYSALNDPYDMPWTAVFPLFLLACFLAPPLYLYNKLNEKLRKPETPVHPPR